MRRILSSWIANSPWWALSAGVHVVLLLGASLVYLERLLAIDDVDFRISAQASRVVICDWPRDILERKAFIPKEDLADADVVLNELLDPDRGSRSPDHHEVRDGSFDESVDRDSRILWGDRPAVIRRAPLTPAATNILRSGAGDGFSQRPSTIKRNYLRAIGCCGCGYTEGAVQAALRWLIRHQNPDGSWSAGGGGAQCRNTACPDAGDSGFDTGVTALSVLAFLGAGYSPLSKDMFSDPLADRPLSVGETVKKGLRWLIDQQDAEGCVGPRGPKYLYNHAIATLALSEGYGMTAADPLQLPAQKAVDFLVSAQNPGKGWRYSARCGDNDTSVTGWAVMALKSAELSELSFPKSSYEGALAWLDEATEKESPRRSGYTEAGTAKVFIPGKNEPFADHPTMSAVSALSRIFIRKTRNDPALANVRSLVLDPPAWQPGQIDFYYWYYASLALFQFDGPGGPLWKKWNEPMKAALVPNQKLAKHGCENGSWDPSQDRWGCEGGRVYATALNCLTLEVYYRYANVFGSH